MLTRVDSKKITNRNLNMVNRNRVKSTPINVKIGFTASVEPQNGSCRHCYTMAGGPLPLISLKYRRN
jgi:hypothetical protein